MIQNIRNEFKLMVKEYDWVDEKSKKAINEKIDSLYIKIGYPDEILDDNYLKSYYSEVVFGKIFFY